MASATNSLRASFSQPRSIPPVSFGAAVAASDAISSMTSSLTQTVGSGTVRNADAEVRRGWMHLSRASSRRPGTDMSLDPNSWLGRRRASLRTGSRWRAAPRRRRSRGSRHRRQSEPRPSARAGRHLGRAERSAGPARGRVDAAGPRARSSGGAQAGSAQAGSAEAEPSARTGGIARSGHACSGTGGSPCGTAPSSCTW